MAFVIRSAEEILAELKDFASDTSATLLEGTFTMDVLGSNALEFAKAEFELLECYRNGFLHTCSDEYIDLRAGEVGCYRRAGNKAVGELEVYGTGTIPAGSLFQTAEGIRFVAVSDTSVEGSGTIAVEAYRAGAEGNVPAGTITKIPINIPLFTGCNNPSAMYDGFDEESDDELRERALQRVRYPAASGNPRHYISWCLEVVGVGAVRVQRCWNGAGTVKIVVIDSNFEPANEELLERVTEKVEAERPIGAEVTIVSAEPVTITVSAKIRGAVDVDAFRSSVEAYLVKLANQSLTTYEGNEYLDYVSIAQVGRYILQSGADDYSELKLNGAAENVPLGFSDLPALVEVTFT